MLIIMIVNMIEMIQKLPVSIYLQIIVSTGLLLL